MQLASASLERERRYWTARLASTRCRLATVRRRNSPTSARRGPSNGALDATAPPVPNEPILMATPLRELELLAHHRGIGDSSHERVLADSEAAHQREGSAPFGFGPTGPELC